jgi:hypothetical protein
MNTISKEARETIEIWRKEIHMEIATEIMVEAGLNYGHPEVIKEIQDSLDKGLSPEDAVSKLSEIAYSMDDADYYWLKETA